MSNPCTRCGHQNESHAKFCLSCGAMLEIEAEGSSDDPLIGKVIQGRYRPTKLLGEGGMGRVYIAEQKMGAATRKVAIKTLHPELSQDPQLVARFNRECETVIELSHPNTIQFFDFGSLDDNTLFIVMEFIEGQSLAGVMEAGLLDIGRIDKILIQVCGSLHEAHGRGIVHRDLKPDNILLTDRGGQSDFVKVLDFGIAKKGEAEDPQKAKLTKQGMVLGTPPYMSPEQFSGKTLDARSDIYSLGAMAFEMLTGSLPFDAKTPWEWATKHLTAQPTPFEAFPNGAAIPQQKKNAVMRALAKSPDQRQSTVLEFLQEFTGQQDTQQAWTMATSAGGQILPKGDPSQRVPVATSPAFGQQNTPAPFGANSPVPVGYAPTNYGSAPGVGPMGTAQLSQAQLGMPGGYGAAPMGTMSGMPMAPAQAAPSGGGFGRIFAVLAIGFFVLVGAAGGLAFFLYGRNGGTDTTTVASVPTTVPTTTTVIPTAPMMMPSTSSGGAGSSGGAATATDAGAPDAGPATTASSSSSSSGGSSSSSSSGGSSSGSSSSSSSSSGGRSGPSAAEEARARSACSAGLAALERRDMRSAIASLEEANRLVGRRSSITRELRTSLTTRGGREVGLLIQRGMCPAAQAMYSDLNRVGAGGDARDQFTDWCRRP